MGAAIGWKWFVRIVGRPTDDSADNEETAEEYRQYAELVSDIDRAVQSVVLL